MEQYAKILIAGGITMIALGLMAAGKLGPLGRLPGDILIERENFKFYFPLTTGILLSVVLSVIFGLLKR